MIIDDTIRDDAIWHAWSAFGGRSWRPLELWQTLPPAVRDRALARVYSNAAPFRAAVVALGRALADAAAAGSVTAHGLGVTRSKSGAYCAIQRSAGAAIPVVDRADALEQLRSLRLELATIAELLQVATRAAAILEDAIARAPGADGVAETVTDGSSRIRHIAHSGDDAGDVIVVTLVSGEVLALAVSAPGQEGRSHSLTVDDRVYAWTGPYARFDQ